MRVPANIYSFKNSNRNFSKKCKVSSKLTIETPERHSLSSGVFIVKFDHYSNLFLVLLLLTFIK